MAQREIKSTGKITIKSLGDARKVAKDLSKDKSEVFYGAIFGIANKTVERASTDGMSTDEYLSGTFEAVPAMLERPVFQSNMCIMPEALQEPIAVLVGNGAAQFRYDVYLVMAGDGWQFDFRPTVAPANSDPLADLRSAQPKKGAK